MYTKFLIILLLIFIVFNSQKLKEKFSNAFQDTEIRAKLSHFGTNLSEKKPLLTLYYDRREPNCKYFYDYFSIHYGGENSEVYGLKKEKIDTEQELNEIIDDIKNRIETDKKLAQDFAPLFAPLYPLLLNTPVPSDHEINRIFDAMENERLSGSPAIASLETDIETLKNKIEQLKEDKRGQFRYQESGKFIGKSQAWNQFKAIYADETDENKYIKPEFLKIEEIEVKDGELYDFNNKPAYKIEDEGFNVGFVKYDGDKPREYKQYYKPDNFLDRIPKLVLSFFKHKSDEEIKKIMEDLNLADTEYANLKHFQKYDYYVIEYDGLYSPNNRQIKTTLDNIIQFINDTYEKYLLCPSQEIHNSRIGNRGHTFNSNGKCNTCSEFIKV